MKRAIYPLYAPADEGRVKPILDALQQKGVTVRTKAPGRGDALVLFLSENLPAEGPETDAFFRLNAGRELVIPVNLDGSTPPEELQSALMARHALDGRKYGTAELAERDYINQLADGSIEISEKGKKALEPYRVRKAIILAAGFGQRLAPVTLDTPKPLVKVNGVRILDTLLDALYAKEITNITIVRGYKKEQFDALLEKYPTIRFIDNPEFNLANNISSAVCAAELIDRCYICEADLYISNPDVINKYEYRTNYLGAKVDETDDWCFRKRNGFACDYQRGGTDCYQAFGISYWDGEDAEKLKADLMKVYNSRAGKENLWEQVPLKICRKNYQIEIRKCHKADIIEIDNFIELIAADGSYAKYPGYESYSG